MKRYFVIALVGLYLLAMTTFTVYVFVWAYEWSQEGTTQQCVSNMYGGGCDE